MKIEIWFFKLTYEQPESTEDWNKLINLFLEVALKTIKVLLCKIFSLEKVDKNVRVLYTF